MNKEAHPKAVLIMQLKNGEEKIIPFDSDMQVVSVTAKALSRTNNRDKPVTQRGISFLLPFLC
jgi:hypothetical protein